MKFNKKGFTLIELLAVIIILGILMIIAIPSVTSYISDSRKNAYIGTANQLISGARNLVNEGKMPIYSTDTSYYIPISCIKTENGGVADSPYGKFDEAYIVVTYDGKGFTYYWVSRDDTGHGISSPVLSSELEEELIESDIDNINLIPIDSSKPNIQVLEGTQCNNFETYKLAASTIKKKGLESGQLKELPGNSGNYMFVGGHPDNYVRFNCNGNVCENWRIIGIYGDKLKIIRVNSIGTKPYYDSSSSGNAWQGSKVQTYLNSNESGGYYYSLSDNTKELIIEATWNIGSSISTANASTAYTNSKSKTWTGKVGLLATYEYLFASNDQSCYSQSGNQYSSNSCGSPSNNWLSTGIRFWTMTPVSSNQYLVVDFDGKIETGFYVASSNQLYPVVYINSATIIESGDGISPETGYILKLN